MKPGLAQDADLDKLLFPCWGQPKIDGVRAWNPAGTLLGRSMDPFKGFEVTEFFSRPKFMGLDGEMILGDDPTLPRLCSLTTGALGRFKGVTKREDFHWFVFDYLTPGTKGMPYCQRYEVLRERVKWLERPYIHLVEYAHVYNREQAEELIAHHLEQGYEGTIWRNPNAPFKEGRATQKGQELWRSKPWGDFEIVVTGVTEGNVNGNEAKKNSLGRTERSSAAAGLIPNGQIGSIQGILLKDVLDHNGKVLFQAGMEITAGSGEMSVEEATAWFNDQTQIVGHIAKVKHMTHGVKDLPRFPTFISKRLAEDMS